MATHIKQYENPQEKTRPQVPKVESLPQPPTTQQEKVLQDQEKDARAGLLDLSRGKTKILHDITLHSKPSIAKELPYTSAQAPPSINFSKVTLLIR